MSQVYAWTFRIGVAAFVAFFSLGAIGALEDFGIEFSSDRKETLMSIFGWSAMLFVLCGFVLWLETITFIRANWAQLSPFQRFLSTFGFLVANITAGYIYHFFTVSLGRRRGNEP